MSLALALVVRIRYRMGREAAFQNTPEREAQTGDLIHFGTDCQFR